MISSLAGDGEDFLAPMFFNSSVSSAVTMRVEAGTGGGQPARYFSRPVVCLHWLYLSNKGAFCFSLCLLQRLTGNLDQWKSVFLWGRRHHHELCIHCQGTMVDGGRGKGETDVRTC